MSSLSDIERYNKHFATVSALIGRYRFNGPTKKKRKIALKVIPIFSPSLNSLRFPSNNDGLRMLILLNLLS
jgi:hypothetical protein